jgi:hypothetical protein
MRKEKFNLGNAHFISSQISKSAINLRIAAELSETSIPHFRSLGKANGTVHQKDVNSFPLPTGDARFENV